MPEAAMPQAVMPQAVMPQAVMPEAVMPQAARFRLRNRSRLTFGIVIAATSAAP